MYKRQLVTFPNEGWNPYDETKNKIILDSTASNVDTITFKVSKSPSVSLSLGTPKNPNGTDAQNYTYPSDKNQNALKTITGLSIPITIKNTRCVQETAL